MQSNIAMESDRFSATPFGLHSRTAPHGGRYVLGQSWQMSKTSFNPSKNVLTILEKEHELIEDHVVEEPAELTSQYPNILVAQQEIDHVILNYPRIREIQNSKSWNIWLDELSVFEVFHNINNYKFCIEFP